MIDLYSRNKNIAKVGHGPNTQDIRIENRIRLKGEASSVAGLRLPRVSRGCARVSATEVVFC